MNKISACLIVYNEEKVVEKCLKSIAGVVDEILVIHDGECKDKTIEICKKYKAKIFARPHKGAMEFHVPFILKQAQNDWILRIDADEFLSLELAREINNLVNNENVDAYEFLWPFWDGEKAITKNWPYKLCLFRKSKVSFLGLIHYLTEVDGSIKRSNLIIEHRPFYNNYTWKIFLDKWLRWAKIQASTYLIDFDDIEKFNYQGKDWPLKIRLRRKYHILLAPMEFLSTVLKDIKSGSWKQGLFGFKVSFMYGLYRAFVNYYVFLEKIKRGDSCFSSVFYKIKKVNFNRKNNYLTNNNIKLEKYKSIYFFIPKIACSSIKKNVADNLGLSYNCGSSLHEDIHKIDFPSVKLKDLYQYKDYFKFGFVRNPWDRILSCYLDKIKKKKFNDGEYANGVFKGFLVYNSFFAGMSFEDFIRAVSSIPDRKSEPHFKSQYCFLTDKNGGLLVDFVGKFENLEKDFNYVAEKINLKNRNLSHLKKGKPRLREDYYDKITINLVAERYAKDIKMFNYEF